jgi:hypothetical protein
MKKLQQQVAGYTWQKTRDRQKICLNTVIQGSMSGGQFAEIMTKLRLNLPASIIAA